MFDILIIGYTLTSLFFVFTKSGGMGYEAGCFNFIRIKYRTEIYPDNA
ncbi:MAG: hypothetical protein IPI59_08780 [Sphingobacteriales bacterium]|nr:hypothetical protein [Sphingobacteriales bacterium]